MTAAVWLIVIVGALAMLQSHYYAAVCFKKLRYQRFLSRTAVFEGEKLELVEELVNDKLTPLPWLRVESKLSPWLRFHSQENLKIVDDRFHRSVFYLRPYSRITRRYAVTCLRRGYYNLSVSTLTVGDLFGLSTKSQEITSSKAKLFVFPRILQPEELPSEALRWQGDVSVRRWIFPDPILINGIRDYQLGDSRRDIHWKSSARVGTLQVKTHDYTVLPRLLLVFNIDPENNFWGQLTEQQKEEMEYSIRTIATLSSWAVNHNLEVGLYSNASIAFAPGSPIAIPPACSAAQLHHILEILAGLEFREHQSIYRTLETLLEHDTTEADILVLSAFWNDALESRCERLRGRGNTVSHLTMRKEAVDFEANTTATPH